MDTNKLISYKLQFWLSIIPFLGFFIVVFTSFYNIKKTRGFIYIFLYWLLACLPFIALLIVVGIIYKLCLVGLELSALIAVSLVLFYLAMVGAAVIAVLIEKSFLKNINKEQE